MEWLFRPYNFITTWLHPWKMYHADHKLWRKHTYKNIAGFFEDFWFCFHNPWHLVATFNVLTPHRRLPGEHFCWFLKKKKSLLENSRGISLVFVVCPILNTLLTYNIIIIYCYWHHHQTQFHKIPTFSKLLMAFSACGVVYSGTDTGLCLPLVFEIGGRFTSWTSFDAAPPLSWNDLLIMNEWPKFVVQRFAQKWSHGHSCHVLRGPNFLLPYLAVQSCSSIYWAAHINYCENTIWRNKRSILSIRIHALFCSSW